MKIYYLFSYEDIKNISGIEIEPIVEEYKYSFQSGESIINKAFQETAKNTELIFPHFINLQLGIFSWCERYNLKKDWLFEYAYYFIKQFNENKSIKVEELKVDKRYYDSNVEYAEFSFKSRGWNVSEDGESAAEYRARVTQEFETALTEYLSEATDRLNLHKLKKATKPPTYQSVEWLVYSHFRNFDAERIVEKFYPSTAADRSNSKLARRAFESKLKHVKNEIKKLKNYGLPEHPNI